MADPLSIAAGVAGLVSVAVQVTQGLHDYYNAYRRQNDTVARLCSNIDGLVASLSALSKALETRQTDEELVQAIENSVEGCRDVIEELEEELGKIKPLESQGLRSGLKNASRRLGYPLRESTLQKLNEDVNEFRRNISTALDVLNYQDSQIILKDIDEIKIAVDQVKTLHMSQKIRDWLRSPDPSSNHYEACTKRHPNTGTWFTESLEFKSWLNGSRWLWLTGFAGSGKSVLCSTAIKETFSRKASSDQRIGVCYFYFSFTDASKQDVSAMIRSVILQLSSQTSSGEDKLDKFHKAEPSAASSPQGLLEIFRALFVDFEDVYILIDALDEVPLHRNRDDLLNVLEKLHSWNESKLHLLATSRDYSDIREVMTTMAELIAMQNTGIDEDIARFIREQLSTNRKLKKWGKNQEYRDLIEQTLSVDAQGVFRWVECQFETLALCPTSRTMLERALKSLPKSLDQTYERMLLGINEVAREEARRVMLFLCFAKRPLFDKEIIDFLAITKNGSGELQFDPSCRMDRVDDILDICPGFLHVSEDFHDSMPARKLQIAHFSVQEYLVSERILNTSNVAYFHLGSGLCHDEIAHACLAYLLSGILTGSVIASETERRTSLLLKNPLCNYACVYWDRHYRTCERVSEWTKSLAFELLVNHYEDLKTIILVRQSARGGPYIHLDWEPRLSALQLASLFGLTSLVNYILEQAGRSEHPIPNLLTLKEVKALPVGMFESCYKPPEGRSQLTLYPSWKVLPKVVLKEDPLNAMHTAAASGFMEIVEVLLDHGMNVNENGADAQSVWNMRDSEHLATLIHPLLFWPLFRREISTSRLLISRGADVRAALQYLNSCPGSLNTSHLVSFLGAIGIDPFHGPVPLGDNLLANAIIDEDLKAVEQCLRQGVSFVQDNCYVTSCFLCFTLDTARIYVEYTGFGGRESHHFSSWAQTSKENVDAILNLMSAQLNDNLKTKAGCADCLNSAAATGRTDLTQLFINYSHSKFGPIRCSYLCTLATEKAWERGSASVLKLLLAEGARPGHVANQLLWLGERYKVGDIPGILDCIKVLHGHSRDLSVNQNFVMLAALGDVAGVQELLENTKTLPKDLAIAWAARFGNISVVKQLVGHYSSYPQWANADAVLSENLEMLEQFLESKIDWTKDDGSALHCAVFKGMLSFAKKLLEHGADPNKSVVSSCAYDTLDILPEGFAPEEVLSYGFGVRLLESDSKAPILLAKTVEMASLLLEYGADVTTCSTRVLSCACAQNSREMAELFIKHGADPRKPEGSLPSILVYMRGVGPELAEVLCDAGAPINPPPSRKVHCSNNPLMVALESQQFKTMEVLLSRGALVYQETLDEARGSREALRILHKYIAMHGIADMPDESEDDTFEEGRD